MLDQLERILKRFGDLQQTMQDPKTAQDSKLLQQVGSQIAELEPLVVKINAYQRVLTDIAGNESLIAEERDPDLLTMARQELDTLKGQRAELEETLKIMLLPRDPRDAKSVIMEIRAGTGGEEAALFAAEMLRMYLRYADSRSWRSEILDKKETGIGGIKEVIFGIYGAGAYSRMKFESGTHRVQRVPLTEASGRIHTSATTVAVLPEAEEVDVEIVPDDLDIEVFRARGHGGQSVNTTDSAVRITHKPSGIVVSCQDERSQLKNKLKAMSILRSRLYARQEEQKEKERGQERKLQVGSGDRSEKIRTYNYPQDRVTDHRIHLNISNLPDFMEGNLDRLIDPLLLAYQSEQLGRKILT